MQLHLFLLQLAGAVMLLLYSTRMVRTGVERAAGSSLRNLFMHTRRSVVMNAAAGILGAVLLQSATAVALVVSGFAALGVMSVTGSLAVVLGADLGTALVVQFLSLDLAWLIPALLTLGGILFLKFSSRLTKQFGRITIGIAFILLSLKMIGEASGPLRDNPYLPAIVQYLGQDVVTAFAGGALLAFVFHSSVAAILLFATFGSAGLLTVGAGLPLVLGANVGGALVALWLTRNLDVEARRITLGNLICRGIGALAALVALRQLDLPLDWLGSGTERQLVNFHLVFNAALLVCFLPLLLPLSALVKRLIIAPPAPETERIKPVSALDPKVLDTPELALASARRELVGMGEQIEIMLAPVMDLFASGDEKLANRIRALEKDINEAHTGIKLYLARLNQRHLTPEQSAVSMDLTNFTIGLERVGDIIAKDLVRLAMETNKKRLRFSREGWADLTSMHARVMTNIHLALNLLVTEDDGLARQLVEEKEAMRQREQDSHDRHIGRLGKGTPESVATSDIHLETVRALKEINSRFATLAYPTLSRTGALLESRLTDKPVIT